MGRGVLTPSHHQPNPARDGWCGDLAIGLMGYWSGGLAPSLTSRVFREGEGMEWQRTSRYGIWQLNGGEPDADGILCTVTSIAADKFLWSVDNVEKHRIVANGSEKTLDAAKEAAERVYSPLFARSPRARADAARNIANAAGSGNVPTKGHTQLV